MAPDHPSRKLCWCGTKTSASVWWWTACMGTHQTVIQALGRFFRNIEVVSGSTVMGEAVSRSSWM